MSTAYTDGILTTSAKKVTTESAPGTNTGTTPSDREQVTTRTLSPRTSNIILYGGAALVGGTILYATYRMVRKKPKSTLSDRTSKKLVPRWRVVDNRYFVFDEGEREFDSVHSFYATIKHGSESKDAQSLTMKDLKRRSDGMYYKGTKVLAPIKKRN